MIYILLVIFIAMLIGTYYLFDKEVIEPAIIFVSAYSLSIFCACLNVTKWNIKLSPITFLILLIGALEFITISYCIHKNYKNKDLKKSKKISEIKITKGKLNLSIFISSLALILLIYNVIYIANKYGNYNNYNNISEMLRIFKDYTSYKGIVKLNFIVRTLLKIVIANAYINIFIFINNIIVSKKKTIEKIKENIKYIICPIIYLICSLLQSNRSGVIDYTLMILTMSLILYLMKSNWKEKIKVKKLMIIGIIFSIILVLFYLIAGLVGRENEKNMFDYITFYVGGSIECLNQYVKSPVKTKVIGEETFHNLLTNLNTMHITDFDLNPSIHLEFRYYKKTMIGNIYTAYRRWIHDFGYIGALVLNGIMAIFFNIFYNKIKYNNYKKEKIMLLIIIYSYMSYSIYYHPLDSIFYNEFVSRAFVLLMFILIAVYMIIMNIRLDFKTKELVYKNKRSKK